MNRKAWVSIAFALLLLFTPLAMAGGTISSYHESESELTNASTQTNLNLQGSGDEAEFFYAPPDLREDTAAEFQNGTRSNVTIEGTGESAVVAYDGFVVGSNHTTNSDFDSAKTLENVTVRNDNVVLSQAKFSDSFEDEAADAGIPDGWENVNTPNSQNVTTNHAADGSQSYFAEDTGDTGIDEVRPQEQPYGSTRTDNISVSLRQVSGNQLAISAQEGGTNVILVGMKQGDLAYYNGSAWNTITTAADANEWVHITVYNIDPSADTFAVDWEAGPDSGSATGLGTWNAISNGYDDTRLREAGSKGYYDGFAIGGDNSRGVYESANHSVTNSEQAAVNLSLTNASATVTVTGADTGTQLNKSTFSATGNHTLTWDTYTGDKVEVNVTFEKTGENPVAKLHDESILFIEQGEYQSQPREAPQASSAWVDLKLPDTTNATVTVEGYDGSTWTALANKKFTSTGNKSLSIGSGYEQYRTRVNYNRSKDGANAELDDLGYDAVREGVYVGQNHTLENASQVFLALELHNATANTTVEGYNSSSGSWENVGGFSTSSSVFDSRNITNTTLDTYRVRLRVSPNSSAANATLTAEGLIAGGGTVVKQVTEETADSTPLLLALSDSPQSEADSIISSLPLTALPDYYQAQITRQIRELFGFEDSTTAAKEASAVTGFYNNNSGAFTAYINEQISGEEVAIRNYDTIQISFNINGENETVYWLGLVDDGKFATTTIENTTSREVDQTLILSGHLAVKSEEELRTAHESFVTTGETPSEGYVAALKGQYGADASGTLINETAG